MLVEKIKLGHTIFDEEEFKESFKTNNSTVLKEARLK